MTPLPVLLLCASLASAQTVRFSAPVPGPGSPTFATPLPQSGAGLSLPGLSLPQAMTPVLPAVARPAPQGVSPGAAPAAPVRALPAVETGDLVFLDLDCGAYCDAIAETTQRKLGVSGPRLAHVGIVEVERGVPFVWEAWPWHGVRRVPLRFFLERVKGGEGQPGGYYLGRLDGPYRALGLAAAARVRALEGRPFDDRFDWGGPGMYCAKLISEAFAGSGFFAPSPMYFGEEGSQAREVWKAYFAARGRPIPDGQPGASPLGLFVEGLAGLFRRG